MKYPKPSATLAAFFAVMLLCSCAAPSPEDSTSVAPPASSDVSVPVTQPECLLCTITEEQFLQDAQAMGLTTDEAKSLAKLGYAWEDILQMPYNEAQDILTEAALMHTQFNLHELGLQLFEYFRLNPAVNLILDSAPGITDEEISAFAIQQLLSESPDGFDFENGVAKQTFDAVCEKYFDRILESYDNPKIRTLPSGNITPTGWSPSSHDFVLKEYAEQPGGRYTAVFYQINAAMGDHPSPSFDTLSEDMANNRVDDYGEIQLVQMDFELVDSGSEEMYLRYHDVQGLGAASFAP